MFTHLAMYLQNIPSAPQWGEIFADPSLPLVVDIGFGSGRFLLLYAKRSLEAGALAGTTVPFTVSRHYQQSMLAAMPAAFYSFKHHASIK